MESFKRVSRQMLVRVLVIMLLACLAVDAGAYWLLQSISAKTGMLVQTYPDLPEIVASAAWVDAAENAFWPFVVPATVIFFLLFGLILWLFLRRPVARQIQEAEKRKPSEARPRSIAKEESDTNKRVFLHLLSVLQREGRLVDFFSENLAQYPDAQIGAAVRSIHENCKKTLDKYIDPQAVLEQQEGEQITVDKDFDSNALKLIGNVSGQPPFTGTVRHRGWRARRIELPTLSGLQDPAIIAPAEVEVG